jgi:hypothetical protein
MGMADPIPFQADDVMNDRGVLVCFKWRGDGEVGSSISVQDIDELGLFHGGYHDASTFWVRGEVLAGNDKTSA